MGLDWSKPAKELKKGKDGNSIYYIVIKAEMKGPARELWNIWKFNKKLVIDNKFYPKKEGAKWFVMYEVPFTKQSTANVDGVKQWQIDFDNHVKNVAEELTPKSKPRSVGEPIPTEDDFEGITVEVNYDIPTN